MLFILNVYIVYVFDDIYIDIVYIIFTLHIVYIRLCFSHIYIYTGCFDVAMRFKGYA